jgi:aerobic-type carbon monoxide dehydrogenase small subunit (CoxS/CutS family)
VGRVDSVRPSGFNRVTRSDPLLVTRPCLEPIRPVVCRLRVNGEERDCAVTPHTTLLEALRYGLRLTGSKQGCDKGDCGACTVAIDGEPALACISLAMASEGREITTIEGLAASGAPHALQDAFDGTGGAQCGFCTPGILISAWALLKRNPSPTRAEIALALSGNLCRCTGYTKIFEAVELAATRMRDRT